MLKVVHYATAHGRDLIADWLNSLRDRRAIARCVRLAVIVHDRTWGIRFSDSEWEEVRTAVENHGVSAAEFVRDRVLGIAWEAEVWLCNTPEYMIHYDGERFIGPRTSR